MDKSPMFRVPQRIKPKPTQGESKGKQGHRRGKQGKEKGKAREGKGKARKSKESESKQTRKERVRNSTAKIDVDLSANGIYKVYKSPMTCISIIPRF